MKHDIKKILSELACYYEATRRIGHTTAMFRGANNVDNALVLTANLEQARNLEKTTPSNITALPYYNTDSLRGLRKPLFIDNHAIVQLFFDARDKIASLEAEIAKLEQQITAENLQKQEHNRDSTTPLADEFYEKYIDEAGLSKEEAEELEAVLDLVYNDKHKELLEAELVEQTKTTPLEHIVKKAVSRSNFYKSLFSRK